MGKTIEVARDREYDQTKTILPAEVARGVYVRNAPSLQALKVMHLMIAKAAGRMADEVQHQFRLSEIRKIDGMRHHDQASLTSLFQELQATVMVHDDPIKQRVRIGGIIDGATVDYSDELSGDLLVSWWFGRLFRQMALDSNHWAIIDRQTVFHFSRRYSVLLFQHIASLSNLDRINTKTFTVPELRSLLAVPEGKLARFSNLNAWALKPAIDEINVLSRFDLTVTTQKIGRTVASVEIAWTEKVADKKAATRAELDRPRVGREARRSGTVETVEPIPVDPGAFPASGPIRFGEWATIARNYLPRPHPDLETVADAYRAWTTKENVPRTETTFAGFCGKWKVR